jgi:hypothetical protein
VPGNAVEEQFIELLQLTQQLLTLADRADPLTGLAKQLSKLLENVRE